MMLPWAKRRDLAMGKALETVRALAATDGPIVIGPWLGEVGFELLYWIPCLRWLLQRVPLHRSRLVVVSRGGVALWYADLADRYVDVFDGFTPAEVKALNAARMAEQAASGRAFGIRLGRDTAKQFGVTAAERTLLERLGLGAARILHPSVMYHLYRLYWRGRCPDLYERSTKPRQLPAGPSEGYVAVKFYSSQACPDRPETARLVRRLVDRLAATRSVVVLDSGTTYDEHGSFTMPRRAVTIDTTATPAQNLAQQTAIIAKASAFVGTYGGFAYLAPFLGVPCTTVWTDPTFRNDHYQTMAGLARRWRVPFAVTPLEAFERTYAA